MNLSDILNFQLLPKSNSVMELLSLNEKTKEQGLVLTPDDIKTLVVFRNKVLRDYARVELGIEVLQELIKVFSSSPYMEKDHYVDTLNELQEIFYYLRNETEDKVEDIKLIMKMNDYFNGSCAGSVELLRSKMEELAENFKKDMMCLDSLLEGDESAWD